MWKYNHTTKIMTMKRECLYIHNVDPLTVSNLNYITLI